MLFFKQAFKTMFWCLWSWEQFLCSFPWNDGLPACVVYNNCRTVGNMVSTWLHSLKYPKHIGKSLVPGWKFWERGGAYIFTLLSWIPGAFISRIFSGKSANIAGSLSTPSKMIELRNFEILDIGKRKLSQE